MLWAKSEGGHTTRNLLLTCFMSTKRIDAYSRRTHHTLSSKSNKHDSTLAMTKTNAVATTNKQSHHVTPHTHKRRPAAGGTIAASAGINAKRSKYGHPHHNHQNNKQADNESQPFSSQPMDLDESTSSAERSGNDGSGGAALLSSFDRLDPSNPVHDHRIKQRRKMIAKGKNTAGYDHYLQQVPKSRRKARSLQTPATPDATLDIPAKRWNGLVRAWCVSTYLLCALCTPPSSYRFHH
jgi:Histone RNA hairpin-binding protein RNA-binding domain